MTQRYKLYIKNEYTSRKVVSRKEQGPPGVEGPSAYQVALDNGFVGSEEEWLQSLTAYGIALDNGFVGTEDDWLTSLKTRIDIGPDDDKKILSNEEGEIVWESLNDKINKSDISWDLGSI